MSNILISARLRGGSTFAKVLMTYSKVTSPENSKKGKVGRLKRSTLVDLDNDTFNLPALYRFFQELAREETFVPSPAQIIPTYTEHFLSYLQLFNITTELNWILEVSVCILVTIFH